MEYKKKMLICDDTMEGIFTAVYDGWRWGNRGFSVGIAVREPDYPELFTENLEIISDSVKAFKVARTIKNRLGGQVYEAVCYAAASVHPEKGTAIFYLLRRALEKGRIDTRVLELLAPHFSDRFPNENWMIYDKTHKVFLVHQAGKSWVLVQGEELNPETAGRVSEKEEEFERLWKGFCSSISIKERENLALQRSHLPIHFRQDMTEFH